MSEYGSLIIERDGPVLTIRVVPLRFSVAKEVPSDLHRDLGLFLDELRHDYSVRVIVLTGAEDGEFICSPPTSGHDNGKAPRRAIDPRAQWSLFMGLLHTHRTMIELEIPIIAKVNGDAIGFGQSLMFACDLVVAREDARICDMHMHMGGLYMSNGTGPVGIDWGTVPGDGAGSLVPLFMSPPLAKEYLMLSRERTGLELAQAGVINRAVKAAELDTTCAELVRELLQRPPFALGWTQRIVNTRVKAQVDRSLDAAAAFEMINFLQQVQGGAPAGWKADIDEPSP